jgi:hypothetical protein
LNLSTPTANFRNAFEASHGSFLKIIAHPQPYFQDFPWLRGHLQTFAGCVAFVLAEQDRQARASYLHSVAAVKGN